MLILDTDHLSVLQRPKTPAAVALNERLLTAPDRDIVTTVVSFEEQVRAWLGAMSDSRRNIELNLAHELKYGPFSRIVSVGNDASHQPSSGLLDAVSHCVVRHWFTPLSRDLARLRKRRVARPEPSGVPAVQRKGFLAQRMMQ